MPNINVSKHINAVNKVLCFRRTSGNVSTKPLTTVSNVANWKKINGILILFGKQLDFCQNAIYSSDKSKCYWKNDWHTWNMRTRWKITWFTPHEIHIKTLHLKFSNVLKKDQLLLVTNIYKVSDNRSITFLVEIFLNLESCDHVVLGLCIISLFLAELL